MAGSLFHTGPGSGALHVLHDKLVEAVMEPVPERRVVMLTPNRTAARRLHRLDHHPVLSLDDIEQFLDEPLLFLEFGVREGFRRLEPQVPVFRLAGTRRKRDVDIGIESREVAPFGLHRNIVTSRRQADRIVGLARVAPRMGKGHESALHCEFEPGFSVRTHPRNFLRFPVEFVCEAFMEEIDRRVFLVGLPVGTDRSALNERISPAVPCGNQAVDGVVAGDKSAPGFEPVVDAGRGAIEIDEENTEPFLAADLDEITVAAAECLGPGVRPAVPL